MRRFLALLLAAFACGTQVTSPAAIPDLDAMVEVQPGAGKSALIDNRLYARVGPDYLAGSGHQVGVANGPWGSAPLYSFWSGSTSEQTFCLGFFLLDPGPFRCLPEFPESVVLIGGRGSVTEVLIKGPETASLLIVETAGGRLTGIRPVQGMGYVSMDGNVEVTSVQALVDQEVIELPV